MELFNLHNLWTLIMLVLLQAVLGFDNLLYISLESKRAPADRRSYVRKMGIGIAIVLRIVLLFAVIHLIQYVNSNIFSLHYVGIIEGEFNLHSLIVLAGGVFIMYTAIKEIWHMMSPIHKHKEEDRKPASVGKVITWIVMMNLVFSFDSILSAMALANDIPAPNNMIVMGTAIVIGGILMIWLADKVSDFLQKNRMYEVLGLFILFIVGIMLLTEGGELAELHLVGNPIEKMSKTTFYFVIAVLVVTDIVQGKYQKKLIAEELKDE